jgi:two-component system chemotaxis response regulator CheY
MTLLKCLIVDDDELGRELTIQYLEGIACCDTATNGREGLKLFVEALDSDSRYDLIMLDLIMPEMDGYEAGTLIRNLEKDRGMTSASGVNIIIISSVNTPKEIINAYMSAQSAAHLSKPVKPEKLLKTLATLGLIPERMPLSGESKGGCLE